MNKLLERFRGLRRDEMNVMTAYTAADKSLALPQPRDNRIITSVLSFLGSKPTRGQIRDLTQALKDKSLPVLQYRAKWHDVIDPSDILGNVLSIRFKKNTNTLVVEIYSGNRIGSWPTFHIGYTQQGNVAVFAV